MKLKKILKVVSNVTEISKAKMKSKNRFSEVVQARNIYFLLASHTASSLHDIGLKVNRNHSTVVHGKNRLKLDIQINHLESGKLLKKCKKELRKSKPTIFRDISKLLIKEKNILKL